jgi:hypothetical protein
MMISTRVRIWTAAGLLAAASMPAATARAGDSAACEFEGSLHFEPGLTFEPRTTDFTIDEAWTCRENDLSGHAAHLTGQGAGILSCAGGSVAGTARLDWDDGTYSEMTFEAPSPPAVGPVGVVTARIHAGTKFKDRDLTIVGLFHGADPTLCSSSGITDLDVTAAAAIR